MGNFPKKRHVGASTKSKAIPRPESNENLQFDTRSSFTKFIHRLFEIGIFLKFANGLLEAIGGLLLLASIHFPVHDWLGTLLTSELLEDPHDLVATALANLSRNFSVHMQIFVGIYLLVHGLIKIGLVIGLWQKRLWVYRAAGVVFSLFIIYQLYLFSNSHAIFQLGLSVLDGLLLVLLRYEYLRLRTENA